MDELDERIAVLRGAGFIDDAEQGELAAVAEALARECGVARTNEHVATLVTHLAAAFKRERDGESIAPIDASILEEVRTSPVADEAQRIQGEVMAAMGRDLSDAERDFVLVHIGGLLTAQACEQ